MVKTGFLQALGVSFYCFLVGTFMWNAGKFFGNKPNFPIPVAILTLFSTSALICALIVFYEPYKLFFAGKKKEALDIVIYTTAFLAGFAVLFFLLMFVFK